METYDTARNKTKTAIIKSFWKLYCKKDVSKITVRDITEATGIHRATFYLYYDNIFAVLDAIKNEQLEKLLRKVWTTVLLRLWNESLELLSAHLPNKTYTSFLF